LKVNSSYCWLLLYRKNYSKSINNYVGFVSVVQYTGPAENYQAFWILLHILRTENNK